MRERFPFKTVLWAGLLVAFVFLLFRLHYFYPYVTFPIVPGLDTVSHYDLGKYYAENIFPSAWGWAPSWLSGMPFPQFYPPLFYMIVALCSKLVALDYDIAFRLTAIGFTLLLPTALALIAGSVTRNRGSVWIAAIVGMILLLRPFGMKDNLGISLAGTFSVGLIPHLIAFVMLLLWMAAYLYRRHSRIAYYLSIAFLAASALSSVHVIPLIITVFVIEFCLREHGLFLHPIVFLKDKERVRGLMRWYLVPGALAVGLTAFWAMPMLSVYHLMPSQSLGLSNGIGVDDVTSVIRTWWAGGIVMAFAFLAALKRRNIEMLTITLSSACVLVYAVIRLNEIISTLPLHTYRLLPFIYFMMAPCAGYTYAALAKGKKGKTASMIACGTIALFLIHSVYDPGYTSQWGYYMNHNVESAHEIALYMSNKKGMFAVEALGNARQLNHLIGQYAGPNLRSNYSVLIDSSISSLYHVPFRTSITSGSHELITVHTLLADDNNFLRSKDVSWIEESARQLGVSYFIIKSREMKRLLYESDRFNHEKSFGVWDVYSLLEPVPDIRVSSYAPALAFVPLGLKGDMTMEVSFFALGEVMFMDRKFDVPIVRANERKIDRVHDIDLFEHIIVSDYAYDSLENAAQRLVTFAASKRLILVESPDPLYEHMKEIAQSQPELAIEFIPFDYERSGMQLQNEAVSAASHILDVLDVRKKGITDMPQADGVLGSTTIAVSLDTSQKQYPMIIHSSYFPYWKRTDGHPVYLATPSYMLTFADGPFELKFEKPTQVYIGKYISWAVILIICAMIYNDVYAIRKSR